MTPSESQWTESEGALSPTAGGEVESRTLDPPLDIRCDFSGAIAETCIEFSALDQVLYNTMNNAIRESDPRAGVRLHLLADRIDEPRHLRVSCRTLFLSIRKAVWGSGLGAI